MRLPIILDRKFEPAGGLAWIVPLPDELHWLTDSTGRSSVCPLGLLQDGVPIGPAHAVHADIQGLGGGRFSLWETTLYFSTPDGSDPNCNGRTYTLDLTAAADKAIPPRSQDDQAASEAHQRTPVAIVRHTGVNTRWARYAQSGSITLAPMRPIAPTSRVFTIGSCFAMEVRRALDRLGVQCVPDYSSIDFDSSRMQIDTLPDWPFLNTYNSFAIMQELERALGLWTPAGDDHWKAKCHAWPDAGSVFQEPYRRLVFGRTAEDLAHANGLVTAAIRDGLHAADVFIITFGMAEVFVNQRSGRVAAQKPLYAGGGGVSETTLHLSSVAENTENMVRAFDLIRGVRPEARVIFTVSPVPLERTFSGRDVVVANAESKATLRAAVGEALRIRPQLEYFPSWEIVGSLGQAALEDDLRHVRPEVVDQIMSLFHEAYFAAPCSQDDPEPVRAKPDRPAAR